VSKFAPKQNELLAIWQDFRQCIDPYHLQAAALTCSPPQNSCPAVEEPAAFLLLLVAAGRLSVTAYRYKNKV